VELTYSKIEEHYRDLDSIDAKIVYNLNRIRDLQRSRSLVEGDLSTSKPHAIRSQNEDGGKIAKSEDKCCYHCVVILAHIMKNESSCEYPEANNDHCIVGQPVLHEDRF
jgi:hypothetical protein